MAYILSFFLIFCIYFQCFSSIPLQFSFFEPVPCAKYSCIEKKESCAQSKIIEGKIEVTLSPICKENEKCDVGGDIQEKIVVKMKMLQHSRKSWI